MVRFSLCIALLIPGMVASVLASDSRTGRLLVRFDGSLAGTAYTMGTGEFVTNGTFTAQGTPTVAAGVASLDGTVVPATNTDGFKYNTTLGSLGGTNWVAETIVTFDSFGTGQRTIIDVQGDTDLRITGDGSQLEADYWDGTVYAATSIPLPATGTAVHYALVWNAAASSLTAYVNGQAAGTIDNGTFSTPDPSNISFGHFGRSGFGGRGIDGSLDAVAFSTFTGSFDPFTDFSLITPEPPGPPEPIVYDTLQHLLPGDTDERIIEKAAKLLPHPRQVEWQRMETTFFIHYGPNAFTGVEWGTGKESPAVFNPTALDASQWVREIAAAGGKMIMLVVKHHDGFCLWPSRYTAHDLASSPWLGGNGDVVRMVATECAARGVKFGVYLSPADLFQIESPAGYYGNGSTIRASVIPTDPASFASNPSTGRTPPAGMPVIDATVDDYNRYFLNQLYELLTDYGPVTEVWFDGATPKQTNPPQQYDRSAWYRLIRTLRPDATIAVKGPDVRWVGNESGVGRETEWSSIPVGSHPDNYTWGDMTAGDLGSRAKLLRGNYLTWYPAETNTTVLHGWFWAAGKGVRTASQLIDIHYQSVGRNSNMLLNVSPDNRGLIPENQLAPLRAMSQVIGQTFGTDLAAGAVATAAAAPGQEASFSRDGNLDTWWEAPTGQSTGEVVLTLPAAVTFDVISLQEAIAQRGQRVESFAVDTWNGSAWSQKTTGTTIGHKRLLRLSSPVTSDRVRVRILQSRLAPTLANVSLHKQADMVAEPSITRNVAGQVSLAAAAGESIRYTVDGSTPVASSPLYQGPFELVLGGVVKAVAYRTSGSHSLPASRDFGIAPVSWSAQADSGMAGHPAVHAIDGDPATYWQTATGTQPHTLTIDLGSPRWIGGLRYLPRQDGNSTGIVKSYRVETSANGSSWTNVGEGSFDNIRNNPVEQTVSFTEAVQARWVRFISVAEVDGNNAASAAEISIMPGGFDAWKADHGCQNDAFDSDSDGDGRGLWEEYVFGGSPVAADTGSLARFVWTGEPPRPAMNFSRRGSLADVKFQLLATEDLAGSWGEVEASFITSGGEDGIEDVICAEIDPPADARRFYRLIYAMAP